MVILLHSEDEERLPSWDEFRAYALERAFAVGTGIVSFYRPSTGAGGVFRYSGPSSGKGARESRRDSAEPELYATWVHMLFNGDPATSRCVAWEIEEVVSMLAQDFGLRLLPDLEAKETEPYSRERFLQLWEQNCLSFLSGEDDHVRWDIADTHEFLASRGPSDRERHPLDPSDYWPCPAEKLKPVHEWNRWVDRQRVEREVPVGFDIPMVNFLADSKGKLHSVVSWVDASPVVLPETDYVLLHRHQIQGRRKSHRRDGGLADISLVPFVRLRPLLRRFPRFRQGLNYWTFDHLQLNRKLIRLFEMEKAVKEEPVLCHMNRAVEEDLFRQATARSQQQSVQIPASSSRPVELDTSFSQNPG